MLDHAASPRETSSTRALCAIAVMIAVSIGAATVALPFRALALGAGPWLVGTIGGILMAAYAVGCMVLGPWVDHVRPRTALLVGNVVWAIVLVAMGMTTRLSVLLVLALVYGAVMVAIWPPLMGWVSYGHEGPALNRRLGRYNMSWSGGMVIGPFLGGVLFEKHYAVPFVAAGVLHGVTLLVALLVTTPQPDPTSAEPAMDVPPADPGPPPIVATFRTVARIGLVGSFIAMGVQRFQLPTLANDLQIREAVFGAVVLVLSLANVLCFAVLGRTHKWHYRLDWLLGVQVILAAAIGALVWARGPWALAAIAAVVGACVGLTYSSSLYYGVSGGRRRGRLMAIHEMLLSVGFVIGAIGGGFVSDVWGLRAAYPVSAALILVGVVAQVVAYRRLRPRRIAVV